MLLYVFKYLQYLGYLKTLDILVAVIMLKLKVRIKNT